ncbi:MAG: hypothetical protein EFT35_03835 [Methanophagales archaeon ANME-1-THS]|nr:MAG: hypothetical protein EFT35_03835 [Methanophagales archaeon ANME-1-THS]
MVLSIVERIKGFLFNPSATFDASKEDRLGDAFTYFVVILAIYAVLIAIIAAGAFSVIGGMYGMMGVPVMPWGAAMGPLVGVLFFVYALVGGIIGVFILGLWLHLWVYLFGGRNGVVQTIKAVIYGETPGLVLGWIPVINIIAGIWALIVWIIGVRQLQELSTGKAVIAVIFALIIPTIIIGALIAAFIIGQMMPGTPMGPRFGGY